MLLQDFIMDKFNNCLNSDLLLAFEDIVNNVHISDSFSISHPRYKTLELPPQAIERLSAMPSELQQKYLISQLRSFLYGIHYNGSLKAFLDINSEENISSQNLENKSSSGIDLEFYEKVDNSNMGEGYFDDNWLVLKEEGDGTFAVFKNGLTVHIERDLHLRAVDGLVSIGDLISIRLPKSLLQSGFYMAVSNSGPHGSQSSNSSLVRIYWSLSPEGAVAVMNSLTQGLNELNIPFVFKILYNPSEYKRYDSGVLYFSNHYYEIVRSVVQSTYIKYRNCFSPEIPLFTKFLAPGVGLAEEPDKKFVAIESFGLNRCQIVSNGLLLAHEKKDVSPDGRMSSILHQFLIHGIDIQLPYLNADSKDIYLALDV
jgi:HopA1 effector protein family